MEILTPLKETISQIQSELQDASTLGQCLLGLALFCIAIALAKKGVEKLFEDRW